MRGFSIAHLLLFPHLAFRRDVDEASIISRVAIEIQPSDAIRTGQLDVARPAFLQWQAMMASDDLSAIGKAWHYGNL
jgi:hypothetical protein